MRILFASLVAIAAGGFIALLMATGINTGVVILKLVALLCIPAAGTIIMAILKKPGENRIQR